MKQFVQNSTSKLFEELNGTKANDETSTGVKSALNSLSYDLPYIFAVNVDECQDILPTMYWPPKLHKRPYNGRVIANSCTTTELSNFLSHCYRISSHTVL